ncbi:hypothetical protein HRM2_10600 [Desulforapulum autotrophicum HRM2]|uniref:Uncharacterized protein n=2 Tax=Desulforapulum autotrophicum TaxID=2296 RepID=C0QL86_DESAH|nr:hypothetical protein HRM2_10600 [Desulforapulum autotrophicum HRM2]
MTAAMYIPPSFQQTAHVQGKDYQGFLATLASISVPDGNHRAWGIVPLPQKPGNSTDLAK